MDHIDYFNMAATEARKSLCKRGHCGAVVVKDGEVVGRGYNAPPLNDSAHQLCHLDQRVSRKPKSDRTCCLRICRTNLPGQICRTHWLARRACTSCHAASRSGNDAAGRPAYLEATNLRNVPLYERFGFKAVGQIKTRNSPPIIPMVRAAR